MITRDVTTLGFFLMPGFPLACLSSAIEPLRVANEIAQREIFRWRLLSEDGGLVHCSAGVSIAPDSDLKSADQLGHLFILSGPNRNVANPKTTYGRLRHLARHGCAIGAFSAGIFTLARSGLLDGRNCSVHWCYTSAFAAEFPEVETTDNVISLCEGRPTASGAAAVLDLMLHLIEKVVGPEMTVEIACWFQHPVIRDEGARQRTPAFVTPSTADELPPLVAGALDIFSRHLDERIDTRMVAKKLGVSVRQLERVFESALGVSPGRKYRMVRMHAARQLIVLSDKTITEIAQEVGYSNVSSFIRTYQSEFGKTPSTERHQASRFRNSGGAPVALPRLRGYDTERAIEINA